MAIAGSTATGATGRITVGANTGNSNVLYILPGSTLNAGETAAPSLVAGATNGGTGAINMTGGALNTTSELWLSSANGATGVMNMSGGSANIGSWLAVGRGGNNGVLNVSGGSINVATNNVTIASFAGNAGTLNVSGGTVHAVNAIYDGESGAGAMNVSGSGAVTVTSLFVGRNSGANGSYTQTGGLLTANGTAFNAANGVGFVVGSAVGSSGTMNVSGGTITGGAPLMVWGGNGSITISQSGAAPTLVNPAWITLGQLSGAVGTITQNGGTVVTNNDNFYIGWGGGAQGFYNMHGGSMTVNDFRTDTGTATAYQDGGLVTVNAWLRMGMGSTASTTYTLAGGTLNVAGGNVTSPNPDNAYIGENGTGILTIGGSNGGTMIVSPTSVLTVALGATANGTLNLQPGGLLRTPDVAKGSGTATFNFSGGTLQNAASGNLAVTMPVNLSGSGTVVLDNSQSGAFTALAPISGGGSLTKDGGGSLTLSGTNTYSGGTNVFNGTLIVTTPQGIEDGTNLYVGSSGSFFAPVVPAPAIGAGAAAAVAPVPEPGTWLLVAAGTAIALTTGARRRWKQRRGPACGCG
jgi:autotransporter-associated beta strand protein